MVPNDKISSSTLSGRGTKWLVCILCILVGVSLEMEVTSLMKRILEVCSWKLIACGESCAASDREGLPQILTFLLMMTKMIATGPGLGLLPVSLFHKVRTIIITGGVKVYLAKVWAMML